MQQHDLRILKVTREIIRLILVDFSMLSFFSRTLQVGWSARPWRLTCRWCTLALLECDSSYGLTQHILRSTRILLVVEMPLYLNLYYTPGCLRIPTEATIHVRPVAICRVSGPLP